MSTQEMFAVLGIGMTKDENEIRMAYRKLLVGTNPEDDPEGFKRLRGAYEEALTYARKPEDDDEVREAEWMEEKGLTGEVLRQLSDIYKSLPRRLDLEEWKALLNHPVFQSLDEGEPAKWGVFSYLADHYRVKCEVWRLLDELFFIRENEQEFREHLPEGFIDFILYKLSDLAGNSDFTFELFEGEPEADYDGFLEAYMALMNGNREETPEGTAEIGRRLQEMAVYDIFHPWYELEKARYLLRTKEMEAAEQAARELIAKYGKDEKVLLTGAGILLNCGHTEDAEEIYKKYLEREKEERTNYGNYACLYGLAGIEAARENWEEAREFGGTARDYQNTEELQSLLEKTNRNLIEKYLAKEEELTEDEADMLGWCFINTGRAEEGWKFFEKHQEYKKDTLKWHKMLAVTAMSAGQPQTAVEEGRRWRTFLDTALEEIELEEKELAEEPEDAKPREDAKTAEERKEDKELLQKELARSYHLEGRSLRNLYQQMRADAENANEEQDEELKRICAQAMEAHDKAIELDGEDIDFRMHKMMLLRDLKDYQGVVDQCEKILELDGEFFWACSYMQEAYENLRMAQEVVDTFYRAKEIYAGNEEIYLRALRVFKAFDQYEDAMNIIKQAEAAGVDSLKLMVEKIGVYDHVVDDEEGWQEADDFAKAVIERLEREEADTELLAEAYLKRAYLNDTGDKKVKQKERKLDQKLAEKSLELHDTSAARYYLGRYYVEHGKDPKRAYEHLKICEERGMDYEWMYFYIAQCHEKFREWDKAIEYYKKVAEVEPEFRDCYWRIGWLYRTKFNRTLQQEYADKALYYINLQGEKFGEIPDHNRRRSFIYLRMKEFDKALMEIEKGIEKDADCGMWYQKGQILKAMGRYEEAITCFENSIRSEDRYGEDDESCYDRIFQCFLRLKRYDEGIAYFKKVMEAEDKKDADIWDKCMYALSNLEGDRGNTEQALYWLEQRYGSVDLHNRVKDGWDREGDRIEDVLDVWMTFRDSTEEELEQKCKEAAYLGQEAMDDLNGKAEDRAVVCQNVGEAFFALGDFETARKYLERAREISKMVDDYDYSRSLAEFLMKTYYWLKEPELAGIAGDLYRKEVEKDFLECGDLGLDMETLLTRASTQSKQLLYKLFCWAFYTGRNDRARSYLEMMEERVMCWWCDEDGCTELWEVKGLAAMLDGDREAAIQAFTRADQYCWLGGVREARMIMRRLKKEIDSYDNRN